MRGLYYAFTLYTHHIYSPGSVNYKTTILIVRMLSKILLHISLLLWLFFSDIWSTIHEGTLPYYFLTSSVAVSGWEEAEGSVSNCSLMPLEHILSNLICYAYQASWLVGFLSKSFDSGALKSTNRIGNNKTDEGRMLP
jgi:hypothetical protein